MSHLAKRFVAAAVVLALAPACRTDAPTAPVGAAPGSGTIVSMSGTDRTPFQLAIMETMARRAARGLPVPSDVSFGYQAAPARAQGVAPGGPSTTVARTVIHFDNPGQAGHDTWPDLVVRNTAPSDARGFVREGNYSQIIKEKTEAEIPGIWQQYEYGREPRTYTFTEELTDTHGPLKSPIALSASTSAEQLLMGLTIPGPGLNYTIDFSYEVCVLDACATAVDFLAGFQLDWAFGLRLPMDVSLTRTSPMSEGSTYSPTSVAAGVNWSALQFAQAGVLPEDGNEYVTRFDFVLGVFLEVFGADVIDQGVNVHVNKSNSFATPFGPGSLFDIPPFDIPIWDFDASVASGAIGFRLTPEVGSEKFTAQWAASSEASGAGGLTYTNPAVAVVAGPLLAIDGPGVAAIRLDDFRYHFTKLLLDLGIFFHLDVFGVVEETFTVPVTDFDLSAIVGTPSVGVHSGTAGAFVVSIPIENVVPTAEIDRTGTVLVNGVATFMTPPAAFMGTARDPGRDDLTLTWDWNDGAPTADVTTIHTVPHEVTETQSHTFDGTCVYQVRFKAVDDDLASAEDQVPVVVIAGAGNRARLAGYWQHQLGGHANADFDAPALECLLRVVAHVSAAFGEARDASTVATAADVLHLKQNGSSARERLDRQLLVAWLNYANGAFGFTELVDADGDGISETPFAQVLAAAELVRLNPGATNAQFDAQTAVLHAVNTSGVGGAGS